MPDGELVLESRSISNPGKRAKTAEQGNSRSSLTFWTLCHLARLMEGRGRVLNTDRHFDRPACESGFGMSGNGTWMLEWVGGGRQMAGTERNSSLI
jgi:hypothetical protein